jgi:F0F1-type ATP synthase assembly protein I
MEDPRKGPGLDPELFKALKFSGTISLDLASGVLLGYALGRVFDRRYQTEPFFASGGFLLGAGMGFYGVYKLVTAGVNRDWRRDERKGRKSG